MQLSGYFEGELTTNFHELSNIRQIRQLEFIIIKSIYVVYLVLFLILISGIILFAYNLHLGPTNYRNGPKRTETDRNGLEWTLIDLYKPSDRPKWTMTERNGC